MKILIMTLLLTFSFAATTLAGIGGGPYETSLVDLGSPGAGVPATWASLFVLPDGSGPGFDACYVLNGGGYETDAVVLVTVIDPLHGILAGYPAEDLWLEGVSGGVAVCGGGSLIADGPSNAQGVMTFARAPTAGGWNANGLRLYFNGMAWMGPDLPIRVNSADINGDGRVNLSDSGFFGTDLFVGPYNYRSDFNADDTINLSDVGYIATNIGANCP